MDPDQERDNQKTKERYTIAKGLSMLSQIGFSMAACVCVGVFLGRFLDGVFHTAPVLLLVGALLGSAAAFKVLFDIAKDWNDK